METLTSFIASDIRTATPILLAALGIVFSERAGIVNIGTEGLMLIGALAGVSGSYFTGSVWGGLAVAMLTSMFFAAIFGYFTIVIKADQTVIGTGINILALGLTTTVNRAIFGSSGAAAKIDSFKDIAIPGLSRIPILGESLFTQTFPVYLALILVPIASFVMFRTNVGLQVRAVGENPLAADTMGIKVDRVRFLTVLYSGIMAGLGGAYLSMGKMSFFTENMTAGVGFMALAAVVFGNYRPVGVLYASVIFGASTAIMYRLQTMGIPISNYFVLMLPYVITIISVCGLIRKSNRPASSGRPYIKS